VISILIVLFVANCSCFPTDSVPNAPVPTDIPAPLPVTDRDGRFLKTFYGLGLGWGGLAPGGYGGPGGYYGNGGGYYGGPYSGFQGPYIGFGAVGGFGRT
jgi:hypothetical protein